MRYIMFLLFLFLSSACNPEFIEPVPDKDEIEIEVDSIYNEYTVTITI